MYVSIMPHVKTQLDPITVFARKDTLEIIAVKVRFFDHFFLEMCPRASDHPRMMQQH